MGVGTSPGCCSRPGEYIEGIRFWEKFAETVRADSIPTVVVGWEGSVTLPQSMNQIGSRSSEWPKSMGCCQKNKFPHRETVPPVPASTVSGYELRENRAETFWSPNIMIVVELALGSVVPSPDQPEKVYPVDAVAEMRGVSRDRRSLHQ